MPTKLERKGEKDLMAKLVKMKYRTSKGETKVYSYMIAIPKKVIISSGLSTEKNINFKIKNGKVVLYND